MRVKLLAALLFAASGAIAAPVINAVAPAHGPVVGGTTVTIAGSGFNNNCVICSPPFGGPQVFFGVQEAVSVTLVSSTLIEAVTPPSVPRSVDVMVRNLDGSEPAVARNAFTYEGDVFEGFEPVLFPVFTGPIAGQGGSEFRTTAKFWNKALNRQATFYGLDTSCTLIDPPLYPENPFHLEPRQEVAFDLHPGCNDSIGKLFYVPRGDNSIAASLRVSEMSQQDRNHGVEIPVVRRDDFSDESIGLVDVPTSSRFRLTLRIYGLNRGANFVNLGIGGLGVAQLPLQPGRTIFEPSYAVFTDFRSAFATVFEGRSIPATTNVIVDAPRGGGDVGTPIWAFITVTNNETQHITTITPQQ